MRDHESAKVAGRKRVFLGYPENWDELTDEEKEAAANEMADYLAEQLGITFGGR